MSAHRILVMASLAGSLLNFRRHLLCEMVARGHRVHVCAPDFSVEEIASLSEMGVQAHAVALQRTGTNPLRDALYMLRMMMLLRRLKMDVCLAYTVKPVVFGLLAAWLAGVERRYALITGVGYALSDPSRQASRLGRMIQALYRLALARCRHVFFQNPDDCSLFADLGLVPGSVPATVLDGSGVDLQYYKETALPEGPPAFLMIARLLGDKGVREYAAAASALRQEFPQVKCRLAGWIDTNPDAIARDELEQWQRAGSIEFLGQLADVRPALADAVVYVLPSYREGTPRTVLEAMAMGRPVITTAAPGCRETVVNGLNGYLVPIKSPQALLQAMRKFVLQPSLARAMGKRSRAIAEEKYDVEKVNEAMLAALRL